MAIEAAAGAAPAALEVAVLADFRGEAVHLEAGAPAAAGKKITFPYNLS